MDTPRASIIPDRLTPRSGLKSKLLKVMVLIGVIPLVMAITISYIQGTKSLIQVIGSSFQALAYETSTKVDLLISEEIKKIKHFASHPSLFLAVLEQNKTYSSLSPDEYALLVEQQEKLWAETGGNHPDYLAKRGAQRVLESFVKNDRKSGPATEGFFVTDARGHLVASINRKPGYRNKGLPSLEAFNRDKGDIYIGELYYDPKVELYLLEIATPIYNRDKQRVGALHRLYSTKDFFSSYIEPIVFGETGHVMLIDSKGRVVDCPILPTGHLLTDAVLLKQVTGPSASWAETQGDGHGSKALSIIGFSPLTASNKVIHASSGLKWYTFAWQASEEVFAPTRKLFWWATVAGFIFIGLIAILGSVAADQIVRPILELQKTAVSIGRGEEVPPLEIRTHDEIEILANEINTMNTMLQKAFSGLEQQVQQKTQEVLYLKEYVESILMSVPEPILIFNNRLEVEYANTSFGQLTGTGEKDCLGKTLREMGLEPKKEWAYLADTLDRYIQRGKQNPAPRKGSGETQKQPVELKDPLAPSAPSPVRDQQSTVTLNNRIFTYQFFDAVIKMEAERRAGLILTDITEEKRLLDQLTKADKLSGLGTLAAGIAHEMNNPLYSIMGFSEAILDSKDAAQHTTYAQKILDRSKHMASIILNMSGYARTSEKDHLREVNVNECLETSIEIALMASYSDDIELERNLGDIPMILAKKEEVQQIFINIIKNAVQAMDGRGKIQVSSAVRDGKIEVRIRDHGPGIPVDYLSKVFDPFFTTKEQGAGSGLGLNIVYRVVEKYGGNIQVKSDIGEGAEFIITFPIPSSAPASGPESPDVPLPSGN